MEGLTPQELAVLLATRCSESAQSEQQLAQNVETYSVTEALERLVAKDILHPFEGYTTDGDLTTVYGYSESDYAEVVYRAIHQRRNM